MPTITKPNSPHPTAAAEFFRNLETASMCIDQMLNEVTGLPAEDRMLIAYYCIATHGLSHVSKFPMLVLKGANGTGKSSVLKVVRKFARRAQSISLAGRTLPTIRDALAGCCEGTAVIEEGDQAWKDGNAELLLSNRCQRDTAEAAHKRPTGDGGWQTSVQSFFGATAIHRRMPFSDAALEGRSITVRCRRASGRKYPGREWQPEEGLVSLCDEILNAVDLPVGEVEPFEDVDARIMDTYSPVISIAQILRNNSFLDSLASRLRTATLLLREGQEAEPEALVLNALIERLTDGKDKTFDFSRRVRYAEIIGLISGREQVSLRSHQIGDILRDCGFKTTKSHGVYVVDVTPHSLIAACEQFGIEDEALNDLKGGLSTYA